MEDRWRYFQKKIAIVNERLRFSGNRPNKICVKWSHLAIWLQGARGLEVTNFGTFARSFKSFVVITIQSLFMFTILTFDDVRTVNLLKCEDSKKFLVRICSTAPKVFWRKRLWSFLSAFLDLEPVVQSIVFSK